MTITTDEVPTKGTIEDALRQAKQENEPTVEPAEQRERHERKPTRYLVVEVLKERTDEDQLLRIIGTFEVMGGQAAARLAAIDSDENLKQRVLSGDPAHVPTLAALASFNPVTPVLENREPKIVA